MAGIGYIAVGVLILLLLPVVVLPWEGRRAPDSLYAAVALAGLGAVWLRGGVSACAWAAAGGLAMLVLVVLCATATRVLLGAQLFTGGHIKLLSAGAIWLGPAGAAVMMLLALSALFVLAAVRHRRPLRRRPDFTAIAALAIMCVSVQQLVFAAGSAAAIAPHRVQ